MYLILKDKKKIEDWLWERNLFDNYTIFIRKIEPDVSSFITYINKKKGWIATIKAVQNSRKAEARGNCYTQRIIQTEPQQ